MSFLNPALLLFASAIVAPILIHLLNRRRFQRVSWAAMRFVQASLEKNRRRMEMEDLLLLILRCLVVALLALALARPALRAASSILDTGRAAAVIILDHSASLSAGDGTRTRFDQAREAAIAAADAYPAGSAVAVLLAGDRVSDPLPEPTPDLNLVRKTLREALPSDLATDHALALARAADILAQQTAIRKEIVLVTDHQAWGWRRLTEASTTLANLGRDARLRVVLVGEPADDNLAVIGLERSPGFVSPSEPLRVHAEIANRGRQPVRQVRVTVHLDSGPPLEDTVLESLAPGESRRVTFFVRLPAPGHHAIRVRIPADRAPFDDERVMMVRAVQSVRVLLVEETPGSRNAFFLRHALQPVAAERAAEYPIQPRIISTAQLALTRLQDFDTVILAEIPSSLPAPAVDALARYVAEGGSLLAFAGPSAQPAFHNAELVARTGLFPVALGTIRGASDPDAPPFALQPAPYEHAVFALWNEPAAGSLSSVRFRAAWNLVAPTQAPATNLPRGSASVMLRFADGAPAAVEQTYGRGRVMMFASTAGTDWNDLAVRPLFVPFLHRSIAALSEAQDTRLNLTAGQDARIRLPAEWAGRELSVVTPETPERRLPQVAQAAPGGAQLLFEQTLQSGSYRVLAPGERQPVAAFAIQPDPLESDLSDLSPELRAQVAQVAQLVEWSPDLDLRAAFDRERLGVELWLPLALAVLLLGMVECWLASRYSRPR